MGVKTICGALALASLLAVPPSAMAQSVIKGEASYRELRVNSSSSWRPDAGVVSPASAAGKRRQA